MSGFADARWGYPRVYCKECGGYLWQEVGPAPDALRILSKIKAEWNADDERRKAERHARGEYTLTEMVEAAPRLRS